MTVLSELRPHIEGIIPPALSTLSGEGTPNLIHVSQAFVLDEGHVGLSRQFFKKTTRNLMENPRACMFVSNQDTYLSYRLQMRWVRAETSGALFDTMRARIDAIAAMTGMSAVFKLQAVDVFAVDSITLVPNLREEL